MNASERITNYIDELADWRGKVLGQLRKLVREAAPEVIEEWKWNTPVWSQDGNIVAIGAFRDHVKINFFNGALLHDSHGLFNAGLEAKTSRGIDIHEGDRINAAAIKDLVRAAVALNSGGPKPETPTRQKRR
jgi:hypothetical protein